MFFSKSSVVAVLALALGASAHTTISPVLGVAGTAARADVQKPSAAKPCGNTNIAQAIGTSTAATANANGAVTLTATSFNAYVFINLGLSIGDLRPSLQWKGRLAADHRSRARPDRDRQLFREAHG